MNRGEDDYCVIWEWVASDTFLRHSMADSYVGKLRVPHSGPV